jgi:glutamate-ammonia-ligase adenylyltransferase
MRALEARLAEALGSPALAARLGIVGEPFLARRAADADVARLEGGALRGVARVVATSAQDARLLASRPDLIQRIATVGEGPEGVACDALARRAAEIAEDEPTAAAADLEAALDELRILRRVETAFAACLHLGGLAPFPDVSAFLSALAESIVRRALVQAQAVGTREAPITVVGMGKIGGREFTYHSDLDLIFLHGGGPETIARASRVAQRLVAYLTTMTGAGVAYAVDARLRPSGGQGMLVTSFDAFAEYQARDAQPWEHLTLMRARAIAGQVGAASEALERARSAVVAAERPPWSAVAQMRARVEAERGHEGDGRIAFKTGPGGLMDVDFLGAGAVLERGAQRKPPDVPSNPALLRSMAEGEGVEALLAAYTELRRIEAAARWVSGRAIEALEPGAETFAFIAAVVDAARPRELLERVHRTRGQIRHAFSAVVREGSIAALER